MASKSRVIYVGMTNGLEKRVWQHKNDVLEGFTKRYKCHRLVHSESFDDVRNAINREKELKGWSRAKKVALIEKFDPLWDDLAADWYIHHRYAPSGSVRRLAPAMDPPAATAPGQCHSEERSDGESAVCAQTKSRSLAPLGMTPLKRDSQTGVELARASANRETKNRKFTVGDKHAYC